LEHLVVSGVTYQRNEAKIRVAERERPAWNFGADSHATLHDAGIVVE